MSEKLSYFAGGKRVTLKKAAGAVVLDALAAKELPRGEILAELEGGSAVAKTAAIPAGTRRALKQSGRWQPVFRSGSDLVVVLPEVRAEDGKAKMAALKHWKPANGMKFEVVEERPGMATLRPENPGPEQTLQLARSLIQDFGAASSSPRLLRMVGRGAKA